MNKLINIIKSRVLLVLCLFLVLITTSCVNTKIKKFSRYTPAPLVKTEYMPKPEMLNNNSPKVIIFDFETGNSEIAEKANINTTLVSSLESVLSENMLADLVNRKITEELKEEISLAEMKKTGVYKGPVVADYAINGTLNKLNFSSKFKEEINIYDPVNMQTYYRPAKFIYTAEVGGIVKVYEVPSMKIAKTFKFRGKKVKSEDVKTDRESMLLGIISSKRVRSEAKELDVGMVQEAARRGIEDKTVDFQNFFAKKGYILEKKRYKDNTIFKISLGTVDGIKAGDGFNVFTKYSSLNAITNKEEVNKIKIAEGIVSKEITPDYAWVKIKEQEDAIRIKLGDIVEMKYKRSFGSKIRKFTTSMAEVY